jgi:hypothetical protein
MNSRLARSNRPQPACAAVPCSSNGPAAPHRTAPQRPHGAGPARACFARKKQQQQADHMHVRSRVPAQAGAKVTPRLGAPAPPPPRVGARGAGGANSWSVQRLTPRLGPASSVPSTTPSLYGRFGDRVSSAAFHAAYHTGNQRGPARRSAAGGGTGRDTRALREFWLVGAGWTAGVARGGYLVEAQRRLCSLVVA